MHDRCQTLELQLHVITMEGQYMYVHESKLNYVLALEVAAGHSRRPSSCNYSGTKD